MYKQQEKGGKSSTQERRLRKKRRSSNSVSSTTTPLDEGRNEQGQEYEGDKEYHGNVQIYDPPLHSVEQEPPSGWVINQMNILNHNLRLQVRSLQNHTMNKLTRNGHQK